MPVSFRAYLIHFKVGIDVEFFPGQVLPMFVLQQMFWDWHITHHPSNQGLVEQMNALLLFFFNIDSVMQSWDNHSDVFHSVPGQ